MEHLIISNIQTSKNTRAVQLLLRKKQEFRQVEIIVPLDASGEDIAVQAEKHWQTADDAPGGLREWGAYEQREHEESYNAMIFALYKSLLSEGDAADMVSAGRQILAENDVKMPEFQALNKLIQGADESKFRELVALTLFIALGKLGRR